MNTAASRETAAMGPFRMLINGCLLAGAAVLDVINPATGEVFAQCALAPGRPAF